ncbi:MAG: hypothetical protein AAGL17_00010 [Cyanobacteria bacterium J06576_12]
MKLKSLLTTTVCLFGIAVARQAFAVPAEPLQAILDDVKAQLPSGMVMRLPTQAAVEGVQEALYATVERTDEGELRIDLGSYPNCTARACMRGYFSSTPAGVEHPREAYAREFEIGRAPITLTDGVVGHYITVEGVRQHSYVLWQQDGQTYVVSIAPKYQPTLDGLTPAQSARQRVLYFAISMAMEPPISRE